MSRTIKYNTSAEIRRKLFRIPLKWTVCDRLSYAYRKRSRTQVAAPQIKVRSDMQNPRAEPQSDAHDNNKQKIEVNGILAERIL